MKWALVLLISLLEFNLRITMETSCDVLGPLQQRPEQKFSFRIYFPDEEKSEKKKNKEKI